MPGLEDDDDPDLETPDELKDEGEEPEEAEEPEGEAPPDADAEAPEAGDDAADPVYAALFDLKMAELGRNDDAAKEEAAAWAQDEFLTRKGLKDEPEAKSEPEVALPTVAAESDERWEWEKTAQATISKASGLVDELGKLDRQIRADFDAYKAAEARLPAIPKEIERLEAIADDDELEASERKAARQQLRELVKEEAKLEVQKPLIGERYRNAVAREEEARKERDAIMPKARAMATAKQHAAEYAELKPHVAVYAQLIEEGKTADCKKLSDVLAVINQERAKTAKAAPAAKTAARAAAPPPRKVLGWAEVKKRMAPVAKVSGSGRASAAAAAAKPKPLTDFDKLAAEDPTVRAVRNHTKSILESLKRPAAPAKKVEKK